jgi:Arc/MetJ-type ribon-helix-helix transcriptional regulator
MTSLKNISLRMPEKILESVDKLVDDGIYATRTEAFRDAARLLLRNQIGMLPGKRPNVSKDELWEAIIEDID